MKLFFAGSTSGEAEASLMLYHQLPVKKKKKQKYEVYKISLASFLVRLSVENILYERQTKFCTEICVYRIPGSDKNGRAQCVRASANVGATVNDGSRGATRHHHYSFFSPALDIADGIFFFLRDHTTNRVSCCSSPCCCRLCFVRFPPNADSETVSFVTTNTVNTFAFRFARALVVRIVSPSPLTRWPLLIQLVSVIEFEFHTFFFIQCTYPRSLDNGCSESQLFTRAQLPVQLSSRLTISRPLHVFDRRFLFEMATRVSFNIKRP